MRIFLDTNIFLDLILKRDHYKEAVIILNAVEKNLYEAIILDITLLNIDYIAKKQVKDIRNFLSAVNGIVTVLGADNESVKEALAIDNNDLEDNIQYVSAKKMKCELIVTNDKNFYSADMAVCSSTEFVDKYL